eukprot:1081262-Amphidinium_carterae.1
MKHLTHDCLSRRPAMSSKQGQKQQSTGPAAKRLRLSRTGASICHDLSSTMLILPPNHGMS